MRHPDLPRILTRIAAIALPVALAACASKPIAPTTPAPVATAAPAAPMAPAATPVPTPAPTTALAAYLDPNNPISQKRSVYFAYDSANFNAADKSVIELQGGYLAHHADLHVRVEGNTDERGGSEYNLALGQRRAQSVKSALELLGVKDDQVEAVSFGSEKPKASGHDESAWQQNRRADIMYPSH
jgi:peptidoglycan-associated lipoprotein